MFRGKEGRREGRKEGRKMREGKEGFDGIKQIWSTVNNEGYIFLGRLLGSYCYGRVKD